jgi:hypothetical protein
MGRKVKMGLLVSEIIALVSGVWAVKPICCCDDTCCCQEIEGYHLSSYWCVCHGDDCYSECHYMPN